MEKESSNYGDKVVESASGPPVHFSQLVGRSFTPSQYKPTVNLVEESNPSVHFSQLVGRSFTPSQYRPTVNHVEGSKNVVEATSGASLHYSQVTPSQYKPKGAPHYYSQPEPGARSTVEKPTVVKTGRLHPGDVTSAPTRKNAAVGPGKKVMGAKASGLKAKKPPAKKPKKQDREPTTSKGKGVEHAGLGEKETPVENLIPNEDSSESVEDDVLKEVENIKGNADYFIWTFEEETELIEAMKIAKSLGHKSPQGFRKTGPPLMLEHMKKCFPGIKLTLNNIKHHIKTWRKQYLAMLTLIGKSGTGWEEPLLKFDCLPEVWKDACKKWGKCLEGKWDKPFPFYHDWVEIYGTDRASGQKVVDFQSAAKKILANDNYKGIVGDDLTVDEDGVVGTGSNAPDASESTTKSKRKRGPTVPMLDAEFMEQLKTIVGPPLEFPVSARDLRSSRLESLDKDLRKYTKMEQRERLLVGDVISTVPGKLEFFYSLSEEDREEYVKVELCKLNKDAWD